MQSVDQVLTKNDPFLTSYAGRRNRTTDTGVLFGNFRLWWLQYGYSFCWELDLSPTPFGRGDSMRVSTESTVQKNSWDRDIRCNYLPSIFFIPKKSGFRSSKSHCLGSFDANSMYVSICSI